MVEITLPPCLVITFIIWDKFCIVFVLSLWMLYIAIGTCSGYRCHICIWCGWTVENVWSTYRKKGQNQHGGNLLDFIVGPFVFFGKLLLWHVPLCPICCVWVCCCLLSFGWTVPMSRNNFNTWIMKLMYLFTFSTFFCFPNFC